MGRHGAYCSLLGRPGGYPGASFDILELPLGSPVASWSLLRDSEGLLRVSGVSCGFLWPAAAFWGLLRFSGLPVGFWDFLRLVSWWACCGFLGPPAVFWGLLGFLRLPMASLGRRSGLAVWLVESSRMPHSFGTLQTVSQSVSCSTGIVLLNN